MHVAKNTILFRLGMAALLIGLAFSGCAGTAGNVEQGANAEQKPASVVGDSAAKATSYKIQQEEKQAMLEQTFSGMLNTIRTSSSPQDLLPFITDTSEYWLDSLEEAAFREQEGQLNERAFCEVYAILRYRIYEREHLWGEISEDKMLSLVLAKQGILDRLTELKLGPMKIKEDRGSVGLATSPEVPVILFVWDDVKWEFDLRASMPLVTKGIETIGVKKNWSNTKLALYLLEKEFRFEFSRIDESLLNPVGF